MGWETHVMIYALWDEYNVIAPLFCYFSSKSHFTDLTALISVLKRDDNTSHVCSAEFREIILGVNHV